MSVLEGVTDESRMTTYPGLTWDSYVTQENLDSTVRALTYISIIYYLAHYLSWNSFYSVDVDHGALDPSYRTCSLDLDLRRESSRRL